MLYDEYRAMEHFHMDESQFYMLPRELRARMIAYLWIGGFLNMVSLYDQRPKGK